MGVQLRRPLPQDPMHATVLARKPAPAGAMRSGPPETVATGPEPKGGCAVAPRCRLGGAECAVEGMLIAHFRYFGRVKIVSALR